MQGGLGMKQLIGAVTLVALAIILVYAQATNRSSRQDPVKQKKSCYTNRSRDDAERTAHVYRQPDPDYDPVLGFSSSTGPRLGSPPVDNNGLAKPVNCVATDKPAQIGGTLPKFYCTVPGNVD